MADTLYAKSICGIIEMIKRKKTPDGKYDITLVVSGMEDTIEVTSENRMKYLKKELEVTVHYCLAQNAGDPNYVQIDLGNTMPKPCHCMAITI